VTHRILQIIPTLDRSGAEKQLTLLARHLTRPRWDVHVCALTRGGPYEAELRESGIPTTILGKRWKADPAAYWRLARLIRRLRPRMVHTWLFAANAYGRAAAMQSGVPHVIASERCVDPWKGWHELALDRWLAKRTQRIITNSSGVQEFYASKGIAPDKMIVIPNGIQLPPTPTASRADLLTELDLPSDARLIGAVGRLWPQKRVKDLIWAADLLKVLRDDVHLLVIGDGPLARKLRRFRDLIQIQDKVHFLGQRNDVARLMPHFDALWLASSYEGMPNVVMEAMAFGVPVVATDIAGCRDLVVPERTGYLVPVGNRPMFARCTQRILEDAALAQRLGSAARRRIAEHFTLEQMIQRHDDLYHEILND
jgi:glycosyltransferase involved in cell wall biosynthesis